MKFYCIHCNDGIESAACGYCSLCRISLRNDKGFMLVSQFMAQCSDIRGVILGFLKSLIAFDEHKHRMLLLRAEFIFKSSDSLIYYPQIPSTQMIYCLYPLTLWSSALRWTTLREALISVNIRRRRAGLKETPRLPNRINLDRFDCWLLHSMYEDCVMTLTRMTDLYYTRYTFTPIRESIKAVIAVARKMSLPIKQMPYSEKYPRL